MSHDKPYTPNFPPTQGYAQPPNYNASESHPMLPSPNPQAGYPVSPQVAYPQMQAMPQPMPQPMQQPIPIGIQPGLQPGFQPGYQPGFQPGYSPGPQGGYPPVGQQTGPIQIQPGGWMTIPRGLSNCPPGLEYLSMIDQLLVRQKVELIEAFVGFETSNKYTIKNSVGQKVYYAAEESDCCSRNICGPLRSFDMKIMDNFMHEVINLHRPLACESCCFPCCLQTMEVSAPPGSVIGSIEQEWSMFKPQFSVKNAAGEVVLQIKGPFCTFSICGDVEFHVYSKDGDTKVGKITKQWSGLAREYFTDADYFGINFPMDLDVRVKALLLGACFLIDFMFFEKSRGQETDSPGMF